MDYKLRSPETENCGMWKEIEDNELIMHILYNIPSVYANINDQYMKDLDNEKDIELEDLRADLRRKYDRLLDQGNIDKSDDDNDNKIIKEEKALKTVLKKQFKGKCRICGKIGHKGADCWTLEANKDKRPANHYRKENITRISQVIVTTATRRDTKSQNVIQNKMTMQIM